MREEKEDGKIKGVPGTPKAIRKNGRNQFGVPVEEHQSSLQVNMFDGLCVFGISENNTAEPEEEKTEHPEKEEQHYEQRNLFEAGPMH